MVGAVPVSVVSVRMVSLRAVSFRSAVVAEMRTARRAEVGRHAITGAARRRPIGHGVRTLRTVTGVTVKSRSLEVGAGAARSRMPRGQGHSRTSSGETRTAGAPMMGRAAGMPAMRTFAIGVVATRAVAMISMVFRTVMVLCSVVFRRVVFHRIVFRNAMFRGVSLGFAGLAIVMSGAFGRLSRPGGRTFFTTRAVGPPIFLGPGVLGPIGLRAVIIRAQPFGRDRNRQRDQQESERVRHGEFLACEGARGECLVFSV